MTLAAWILINGCAAGGGASSLPNASIAGAQTGLFASLTSVECVLQTDIDGVQFVRLDWAFGEEEDAVSLRTDLLLPPADHLRRLAFGPSSLSDPPITEIETLASIALGGPVPLRANAVGPIYQTLWLHDLRIHRPGYESHLSDVTLYCEDRR